MPRLTVRAAAKRTGISARTIGRAINAGELSALKDAGAYLVDTDELNAWAAARLARQARHAAPEAAARQGTAAAPDAPADAPPAAAGPVPQGAAGLATVPADVLTALAQSNTTLSAQVEYLTQQLQQRDETIRQLRALQAPTTPAEASPAAPWWQRVLRRGGSPDR